MPLLRAKYRNMVPPGRQLCHQLVFLILAGLIFFVFTGCRHEGAAPFEENTVRLERAEQAFLLKEYPLARKAFTSIMKMATRPDIRNTAQYGIACVDMITAENTDAFFTVMDSFLHSSTEENSDSLNPQLLILAVSHGMVLMEAERLKTSAQIAALKATEKKHKKERLKLLNFIKTLQHQISSLERIDQERQEKRTTQ